MPKKSKQKKRQALLVTLPLFIYGIQLANEILKLYNNIIG